MCLYSNDGTALFGRAFKFLKDFGIDSTILLSMFVLLYLENIGKYDV